MAIVAAVPLLAVWSDGPPPAHTGGFGEPTCVVCHAGSAPPAERGLTIHGVPEAWEPGRAYRVVVELVGPDMRRAGFQLSARYAEDPRAGRQAGSLAPLDDRVAVVVSEGIAYAGHTATGSDPTEPGSTRWTVSWTAPDSGGPVVFHGVANAADGDDSAFGDAILTTSKTSAGSDCRAGRAGPVRRRR